MLNNITNYTNLINNRKVRTLLDATDLFTIGVRDANFYGNYQPALITATDLVNSVASLLPSTLPYWLEYNQSDLTIWNNGMGNIASNTSYGQQAFASNTLGTENTAIGYQSCLNITTGNYNTALGAYTLTNNTSVANTAIGYGALQYSSSASGNVAIGINAMTQATCIDNIAIGNLSMQSTTGNESTSIGHFTLRNNTSGSNNTALGNIALQQNTTGTGNTAIGKGALSNNTVALFNTAIGTNAAESNTVGEFNTCIGGATSTGNFSNSIILGFGATAVANNQFVAGSVATNAGSVTVEVNTSTQVWNVVINGVARKILLA